MDGDRWWCDDCKGFVSAHHWGLPCSVRKSYAIPAAAVEAIQREAVEREREQCYIQHGEDGYWLHLHLGGYASIHLESRASVVTRVLALVAEDHARTRGERKEASRGTDERAD